MNAPNFFILGAAKSGTTSLAYYLGQHPDVLISTPKEPWFFEAEHEHGPAYYWERYFARWDGQPAAGDARPANLFLPYVPARIHALAPAARLIAILREPGERAHSHWWSKRSRLHEALPFEPALEENLRLLEAGPRFAGVDGERLWRSRLRRSENTVDHRIYLDAGYYAEQLQRYLDLFPREQIMIVLFDDLKRDPLAVIRALWTFLGVTPRDRLADERPQNAAFTPLAQQLWRWSEAIGVRRLAPRPLRAWVSRRLSRPQGRPPIAAATRRWLDDHFRPHVAALERLLARDLSPWTPPPSH